MVAEYLADDELADNSDDERKLERAERDAERTVEDGHGQRTRVVAAPEKRFVGRGGAGHRKAGSTTTAAKL